jgi:hypothetical protein
MTDQQHPITPPPELVWQWLGNHFGTTVSGEVSDVELAIATQAARWGSDQELEACCAYLAKAGLTGDACGLQLTRRPEPPSLKEQALAKLAAMERLWEATGNTPSDIVRRALEALDG